MGEHVVSCVTIGIRHVEHVVIYLFSVERQTKHLGTRNHTSRISGCYERVLFRALGLFRVCPSSPGSWAWPWRHTKNFYSNSMRLCVCWVSDILHRRSKPRESRMENPIGLGNTRTSITLLYYANFKRRVASQSPGHRSVEFTGFFKAFSPLGYLNMHKLQQQTIFPDFCCLLRLQAVHRA